MSTDFKPLKVEDFGLTPEEKKILVKGAQTFFPPDTDEEQPAPADIKESNGSQS